MDGLVVVRESFVCTARAESFVPVSPHLLLKFFFFSDHIN